MSILLTINRLRCEDIFEPFPTLGVFVFLNFASAKKMSRHHSRLCLSLMIFLLEMILIIGNQFVKISGI